MRLTVNALRRTKELGDLFGIFFEDLNHAADGGLCAELVQNVGFEYCWLDNPDYHALTAWEAVGDAVLAVRDDAPHVSENPHTLTLVVRAPGSGVRNLGYGTGMAFRAGEAYHLRLWALGEAEVEARLESAGGELLASAALNVRGGWRCHEAMLMSGRDCADGRLVIALAAPGELRLDRVSLVPSRGYKDWPPIFRRDIAQVLDDMRPKFLRFPGGCLVHDGELNADNRGSMYRWKNSVGPVERRPARRSGWRYNQSLQLGFYEYFVLAELLGAQPLPVLPGGCDPHHRRFAEGEQLQEFIQDALDLIEFAKGGADTEWGGLRARMGHPEPFGLKYLGIGNEEVHQQFYDRFPLFVDAIRAYDQDIQIVGTAAAYAAGGEFERGWDSARKTGIELVDEHYYQAPEWYIANAHRYMGYDPDGPKVFLGEYASWGNTWENALAEAMYMVGLQNAPAVALACYAPMLCHADYVNWQPDMIWFDNHRVMLTPNYHVQRLFMRHQGDALLDLCVEGMEAPEVPSEPIGGWLALQPNDTGIACRDIRLTANGETRHLPDAALSGQQLLEMCEICAESYELSLRFRRTQGCKGMKLLFGRRDGDNLFEWGVGGWENQDSILNTRVRGRGICLTQCLFSVEDGREYELLLQVGGRRIRTYIDGVLMNDAQDLVPSAEPLYATASVDDAVGELILKVVNITDEPHAVEVQLHGLDGPLTGELHRMCGYALDAENKLGGADGFVPVVEPFKKAGPRFEHSFPAHSVSVIRIMQAEETEHAGV